jgi:hypothetical protein
MKISNKVYDVLKWVALVFLDAAGLCYQTLSAIWGFPYGDEVLATCVAVSVCLGTLLQISSQKYKGGTK